MQDLEKRPPTYWSEQELPLTYEIDVDGQKVHVEVVFLTSESNYMQLGVSVNDYSWFHSIFPVGMSFLVPPDENSEDD